MSKARLPLIRIPRDRMSITTVTPRNRFEKTRRRSAFTLIEVLIGATLTLILLSVMIRAFTFAGNEISKGRAVIELSNELRTASDTMRHDLRSATSRFLPWASIGSDEGYFEYVEGITRDYSFVGMTDNLNQGSPLDSYGDGDDILMLTCRNLEQPYQGLSNDAVVESKVAEIAWWAEFDDVSGNSSPNIGENITLHRRVLLVYPSLNKESGGSVYITSFRLKTATETYGDYLQEFLQNNDISARIDSTIGTDGAMVANSLADLTRRENRFSHNYDPLAFPHPIVTAGLTNLVLAGDRQGEDVMLSNVSAFDIKVFDPTAPIRGADKADGTKVALSPSDPGYLGVPDVASIYPAIGQGTYVDLRYLGDPSIVPAVLAAMPQSTFSGAPSPKSQLVQNVYCTWSSHYERDGLDQDQPAPFNDTYGPDQGTNGIDDDGTNGVDDEAERETSPPYPVPLRGVKVTFRVRDPGSQQVRQTSVEASFVPE